MNVNDLDVRILNKLGLKEGASGTMVAEKITDLQKQLNEVMESVFSLSCSYAELRGKYDHLVAENERMTAELEKIAEGKRLEEVAKKMVNEFVETGAMPYDPEHIEAMVDMAKVSDQAMVLVRDLLEQSYPVQPLMENNFVNHGIEIKTINVMMQELARKYKQNNG